MVDLVWEGFFVVSGVCCAGDSLMIVEDIVDGGAGSGGGHGGDGRLEGRRTGSS